MVLLCFGIYRYLQTDIKNVEEEIHSKEKLLLECKKSVKKLDNLKKEYKKIVKEEQDIINYVHFNIREYNIKLKKIHHKKIDELLRIDLVVISNFKDLYQFCQGIIDCLNYRPELISLTISNKGDMKLKTKIKLAF